MWRFFMPAPKEPMDPKQQDTSEHLEVNDAQDMPDNTDIQDQEQQVADEDWATLLSESQTKVAQYHEELQRAKAEVENIRPSAQEAVAKPRKFGPEAFAESPIPAKNNTAESTG